MTAGLPPALIADAYRSACRAELEALKPGNVHVYAHGHGMVVDDFERSALVTAGPLTQAGERVGARVLAAVRATAAEVGTNTNLGILLLCAPLATAGESSDHLRPRLAEILRTLDQEDARAVFEAIRIASPAGLGQAPSHDVNQTAQVDLLTAMRAAADRDRIARAYATDFEDLFAIGLPALAAARARGLEAPWCTTAVYLEYLSRIPDTHIARKYGNPQAEAVCEEVQSVVRSLDLATNPAAVLLRLDAALKARRLNPGTSADFTVATLFADALLRAPQRHIDLVDGRVSG
jgi:triphosphoribosyl-dephospho-CoA synthase